ncbi:glutaminyl-peptide cyclotransferase [Fundidesulfovibrio butyratiphilus]
MMHEQCGMAWGGGRTRRVLPVFSGLALVLCWLAVLCVQALAGELGWRVTGVRPHDRNAFTQGLILADGALYESTGLYGRSSLRKVDIATGRLLRQANLERDLFGEGLALWNRELYVLTWKNGRVLVFDMDTFQMKRVLPLDTQGWGLASTPQGLVVSDGSDTLVWRDPATMARLREVRVADNGRPVANLNELEWVEGFVFANVWHEDRIAVIDPATGRVVAWLNLAALRVRVGPLGSESVLNGMAYDPGAKRLYVTGKNWPKLFELQLEKPPKP